MKSFNVINFDIYWKRRQYRKNINETLSLSWEIIQVTHAVTSKTTHCTVVHTTHSKNSEPT